MNEELRSAKEMIKLYADRIMWLEGKASGLQNLIGKISQDADEVINKHYYRVLDEINNAYNKHEEYSNIVDKYERS
jgi:hypothetical protein